MKYKVLVIPLMIILATVYIFTLPKNPINIPNPIMHEVKADPKPTMIPLNPELIKGEFIKTGEVIVLKSSATYKDTYKSSNWYSSKALNIELLFDYGIGIDLSQLNIESVADNIVSVSIPVNQLVIKYMALQANNSLVQSQKSAFASQYTPEEMKAIIANAQEYSYNNVNADKEVMKISLMNLQELIRGLVMKLGFKDCYFKILI